MAPRADNHVWAYDFVYGACATGKHVRGLTVLDEFAHVCLAVDVGGSIRSRHVIEVLAQLIRVHGAVGYLASESGPRFVSNAMLNWLPEARLETALTAPGNPWHDGTNKRFDGILRDERLSL